MTWYRSLYWRIAVGFIPCLALLLTVQGMLFVWMMTRGAASVPFEIRAGATTDVEVEFEPTPAKDK